jgi:hypothetical protein
MHPFYAALDKLSSRSLRRHLDHVVINASPEPKAWGAVREPWQDELIRHKIPLFEALAFPGRPMPAAPFFCDVLPRGHDKSSLEGRLGSWLLLYAKRKIEGYVLAADKDQGELLIQAMRDEAKLNPWMDAKLVFTRNVVTGPAGAITVLPADAGSAYGLRGNFYVVDELTNWKKPKAKEVWQAVMSGLGKVVPTVAGILTNAGYLGSWQHAVIEGLAKDPLWRHYEAPGPLASWMNPQVIASLRAKLASPAEGRRLYDNRWINAAEDTDYLTRDEVLACYDDSLVYRIRGDRRVSNYIASIDYGPKKDRTVCMIGHREGSKAIIDRLDVWDKPCAPSEVLSWVKEVEPRFRPVEWVIDPYQMLSNIETMRAQGLNVHEFNARGGAGNFEIAQALRGFVSSAALRLYHGAGVQLVDELSNLVCVRKSYGFRIDHVATRHDDQAVAIGQFLVRSHEYSTAG